MNSKTDRINTLIKERDLLENYFANTIIPQLFVDANLILRKFTPPAMKQFNLTPTDIGRNIKEVYNNIRYSSLIENIQEVIATGKIIEKEIQTSDKRWYQMNILPYVVNGEETTNGVIITFVDITLRIKNLEELEKLNAGHTTFLYSVTHDIKQPLAVLSLMGDTLEHAFEKMDKAQFELIINKLKGAVKSMRSIIDGLSESAETSVKTYNEEERINIEDIFEDVTFALKADLLQGQVNLTTQFNTSEIKFSRRNLRSIVYNLLVNAIKYKKPHNEADIFISSEKINEWILISIKDNGLGIDKKNHERIFEKNMRLNNFIEGTGMGLYLIRTMIDTHGGKIELESALGEGSTFKIYFKA